jgi:hypothetical protein
MKKQAAYFILILSLLILTISQTPRGFSQAQTPEDMSQNIQIISYSSYYDNLGYFDAVGEVQNTGTTIAANVFIIGTAYASDGSVLKSSNTISNGQYLLPGQKGPFYLDFGEIRGEVSNVVLQIGNAPVTESHQYLDLKILTDSSYIGSTGAYWVTCNIRNIGNQTATNVRLIGTFYNSTGQVVAMGYSDPQNMTLAQTSSFKVGAFDINMKSPQLPSYLKITGYTLLIQNEGPFSVGNLPTITPYPAIPTSHSDNTINPLIVYVAIVAIAAILIALLVVKLKRRKPRVEVEGRVQRTKKTRSERNIK